MSLTCGRALHNRQARLLKLLMVGRDHLFANISLPWATPIFHIGRRFDVFQGPDKILVGKEFKGEPKAYP